MIKPRFKEKEYFDFYIGKFHFVLKQNYEYTDKHTGKVHYNHVFKISSYNEDRGFFDWLNFYTGWKHLNFVYDTCSYEDNRHHLRCSLGWGQLYLYFPWTNKNAPYGEDCNNPEKKYGFYFYGEGKGLADSFWYYKNNDGHSKTKCVDLPWAYDMTRHSMLLKDGWYDMYEKDRIKHIKNGTIDEHRKEFEIWDDDERLLKKSFPFKYVTKSGELQETTATCYMEEREWRPKCMKWSGLFKHLRTQMWINFKDEMGNQRGSWKGGVLGCGCEITKEEKKNMDFETPLRRYEKEVNRIHDFCR